MTSELKCGLITGVGVCLWILGEFALGLPNAHFALGVYTGLFSGLIPLVTLFLLLKGRRDAAPGGRLGLWAGVKSGLRAAFIAGVIVYAFMFLYDNFINPGWMDLALDWRVAQQRAAGITETAIREQIKFYRQMSSPIGCVLSLVGGTTVLGGLFSAALTLLLRRWPPVRALMSTIS